MTSNSGAATAKFIDDIRRDFHGCEGKLFRASDIINGIDRDIGWFDKSCGYWRIKYRGKTYLLHRLMFAWEHGYLPEMVDHIDRNVHNNVLSNLRAAKRGENTINSVARSDNTSGYKGVTWHKSSGKWHASVFKDKKRHYCGVFTNKDEAAKAYNLKAKELFGEFALLNDVGGHSHG